MTDVHIKATLPVPSGSWSFFLLFNHDGPGPTRAWLHSTALYALVGVLADCYAVSQRPPAEAVSSVINDVLTSLASDLISGAAGPDTLGGSTGVLVAFLESASRRL